MADEKLIFPIGFDLEEGVAKVEKDWGVVQRRLQKTIDGKPLTIKVDSKGLEQFETYSDNMRNSINKIREAMKELDKTWNSMSDFEKFDEGGELTNRAQELVQKYNELTVALQTYGKTLGQIASDAKHAAEEEVKALERKEQAQIKANRAAYDAQVRAGQQALAEQEKNRADYEKLVADYAKREQAETRLTQRGLQYEQERIRLKQQAQQASDKEYENLVRQIKAEQRLAASKVIQPLRQKVTMLQAQENTIDAINRKLQIQQQRLQSTDMGSAKFQKIAAEVKRLTEELDKANARVSQLTGRATQGADQHTRAVERTNAAYKTQSTYLSRLAQRMVAYASVAQAFSFIRNIREVTAQFELQRVALGSIIGDLNEANAMFEQIKAAAVKSPFQIKELVTYTKQLAAYKIETDELFETTQRLADVSAGLGVGMERLVLAYGQIRATGYLRASEVRQLTEAGIPIVEELAKKMSQLRGETVSAAEVMGMISERAISFGMVKEVFDDMTSAGGMFYKMQEKQAETLAGQWSNLQDAIAIMYEEIGNTEGVNNSIKGTIGLVKSLAENWRDVSAVIGSLSVSMGTYYAVMKNATVASKALSVAEATRLSTLRATTVYMPKFLASTKLAITLTRAYRVAVIKSATATGLLSKAFWGLTKAMLSNPYTAVLAALAGLATLLLTTESRAKQLNKELAKIGTEGALQADQSVRNFERLALAIRESADGSEKQTEALKELKRSYGDLLPDQDKEIKTLVQEKSNYDELIKSIRRKIELQIQEQKLSKIISEYSNRIDKKEANLTDWLTGEDWSSVEKFTEQQASDITFAIRQAVSEGLITAEDDWKTIAGKLTKIINETTGYKSWSNVDIMYGVNRDVYEEYVNTILDMYRQIDKVGGALDKLDDKAKALSDTFTTWQKELEAINEGTNDLGDNIRVFDDTTISQITKITDATSRVADEYKRLAKEKERVDKALLSEGAKADSKTHAQLEKRLGGINTAMSMLYNFLEKYGGLDLLDESGGGGKKTNPRIALLNEELSTVEKIYKEYQELRKFMSEEDARARVADMFEGVNLTMLSQALSPTEMRAQLQKALDEAKKMGDKKQILELEYKLGKFDVDEAQREMEKNLKKLSDELSRTKTAKEFFDRMLGMTGDKQLSATLTMSVYGMTGDDLQKLMTKQVEEAFKKLPKGFDITKAMLGDGKFDYNLLESWIEKLPKNDRPFAQSIVDNWRKANADILTDLQKSYEDFMTYEERKTRVAEKYVAERKKIEESQYTQDEKDKLLRASREAEKKELGAIAIEEFKASDDWVKSFENLENLATPTIERLMSKLKEFITLNNEALTPEQLKSLMDEYDKLYNGLITRNPIQAITDSLKEYKLANANIQDIQRQLDFARELGDDNLIAQIERDLTDAFDDAQKANSKLQKGLSELSNKFSQAQQFVSDFADTLGISEDTQFGAFLNGISDALGGVSKAFAFAQLAVQLFDGTIKTMFASNPIGWILLAVSAIISAVQAIANARVKRIDQDIERLEDRLDSLSYAYDRLQNAQEKAFGTEYIQNYQRQLENLEAQQEAYLKQANLERSKGKKADEDKIKEYEEQARDAADAIKDMYGSLSENFLGSDLTSAARDFASAWIDAYKEFSNTTDAMKEKFQDMIQNMVVESLLAKVMEKALKPVFTMIDEMGDGDFYSTRFWRDVMATMQTATENGVVGAENVMSMLEQMGINLRGLGGEMTGISRDIATASEESILGLAAGITTQNFYISQVPTKLDTIIGLLRGDGAMPQGSAMTLQDVMIAQNQFLSHLPTIAQHTAETVAECKQIVAETRRTADALERVIKPDGTRTTYKMNVVTTYQG